MAIITAGLRAMHQTSDPGTHKGAVCSAIACHTSSRLRRDLRCRSSSAYAASALSSSYRSVEPGQSHAYFESSTEFAAPKLARRQCQVLKPIDSGRGYARDLGYGHGVKRWLR